MSLEKDYAKVQRLEAKRRNYEEMPRADRLITSGEVERRLGCTTHQAVHVLRVFGKKLGGRHVMRESEFEKLAASGAIRFNHRVKKVAI